MEKTMEKPAVNPTSPEGDNEQPVAGKEIDGILRKNRELLDEKKKLQREHEELKKRIQLDDEAKLTEQGKLKELLDVKQKRLAELEGADERLKKYDERTGIKIEEVIKNLPDVAKEILSKFNGSIDEKLDYAEKLKSEFDKKIPSVGSERPYSEGDLKGLDLSKYDNPAKLLDLKYTNPAEYKMVREKLKTRE